MTPFVTPIGPGCRVTLHFSLSLVSGEEIDSNFGSRPPAFIVGDGSLLPGFEACLLGLVAGEEVEVRVPAEKGFGLPNPANVQSFPRSRFADLDAGGAPAEPGSVVSFKDAGGFDLAGVIKTMTQTRVEVDFNHPLAGREILFRAKIISVVPADREVVEIRL
ncbi:MAG: peptidylprolyl isomerase [Pseudohongiellaceae bacterium]